MSDMHFDIVADPNNARAFSVLMHAGVRGKRAIRQTFYHMGLVLRKSARDMAKRGARSGRFYSYRGKRIQASGPGEAPQRRSGAYRAGVDFTVHGAHFLEFGDMVPYASFLEGGTSKMRPRPALKKAIESNKGKFKDIGRREIERELGSMNEPLGGA